MINILFNLIYILFSKRFISMYKYVLIVKMKLWDDIFPNKKKAFKIVLKIAFLFFLFSSFSLFVVFFVRLFQTFFRKTIWKVKNCFRKNWITFFNFSYFLCNISHFYSICVNKKMFFFKRKGFCNPFLHKDTTEKNKFINPKRNKPKQTIKINK